jgi:hypothetical protein
VLSGCRRAVHERGAYALVAQDGQPSCLR